jgi:hypothetical protein
LNGNEIHGHPGEGSTDITEENLQIKEALCSLQETLSGVQNVNFHLVQGNTVVSAVAQFTTEGGYRLAGGE